MLAGQMDLGRDSLRERGLEFELEGRWVQKRGIQKVRQLVHALGSTWELELGLEKAE
jgi:hypothetical protein